MKNFTYELFNAHNMNNGIQKVSCRIYNLDETQVEVFDLIITKENEYQAWTYDTVSQKAIDLRKEIEAELNSRTQKTYTTYDSELTYETC